MFGDLAIIPITTMIIGAGFFFFVASIAGIITEPFMKKTKMS